MSAIMPSNVTVAYGVRYKQTRSRQSLDRSNREMKEAKEKHLHQRFIQRTHFFHCEFVHSVTSVVTGSDLDDDRKSGLVGLSDGFRAELRRPEELSEEVGLLCVVLRSSHFSNCHESFRWKRWKMELVIDL